MSDCKSIQEEKAPIPWQTPPEKGSSKNHAAFYVIINAFLWALWFFIGNHYAINDGFLVPWPIWASAGWEFGLVY